MIGYSQGPVQFSRYLVVLTIFNVVMALLCFVTAIVMDKHTGSSNIVMSLIILFFMQFGGLFLNISTLPSEISWIQVCACHLSNSQVVSVCVSIRFRGVGCE